MPTVCWFQSHRFSFLCEGHNAIKKQLKGNECAELKPLPRRPFCVCMVRVDRLCVSVVPGSNFFWQNSNVSGCLKQLNVYTESYAYVTGATA